MDDDQEIQNGESLVQEETRVPLISQEKRRLNNGDEEQPTKGRIREDTFMVYATTFVSACGSYACGSCVGYSSPTQSAIREDVHLSLAEYSMFGSILTFGAMFGAITSGKMADYIGRKRTMLLSSGFCTAGWLFIYFAQEAILLDIGRLATGYGMGVFSYMVPVFIAEVAPKDLRGMLTTLCWVMLCTGVSVSFILGTILTWRTLALTGIIPCAIVLFGLFTIPESPRWLAKRGNQKEFEASLRKLRGKNADIFEEAAEIQDYIETLEKLPKAKLLDLFQKRCQRPVTIGVGLMVCQQFGGINGISFYTSSIFESAGFPANVGTIIYAILPISGAGLVIGCLLTGISFFLKEHGLALGAAPALAVTGILVYVGAFSMGMGVIPWMMMSEIFPIDIKGVAGSLVTLVNWFGAWVCTLTFNFLMSWSSYGTFILYAAINALAIVFVIKLVPETKGRTLEQIHAAIDSS
ncbi:sugar transporter ERD6-like 7 isoform X2 [Henckelia pumila]|uniref:sugar transporter ERD6-like 7 isoform X2 n=1 Tax=Henckelia pumila TaxID=405737 RepID=UPI003C6DD28C